MTDLHQLLASQPQLAASFRAIFDARAQVGPGDEDVPDMPCEEPDNGDGNE